MRIRLIVGSLLFTGCLTATAQAPLKQWDKTFGGGGADYINDLKPTADGGYIMGGESRSGVGGDKTQPNQGMVDYWVVKIDATGSKVWDRTFGGSRLDGLAKILPTPDNGFLLIGGSDSGVSGDKTQPSRGSFDGWVIKIDANGTKQWDRSLGGSAEDGLVAGLLTADGGYLLAGGSNSDISGDKSQNSVGGEDFWLIKLDAAGNKQWDRTIGGPANDRLTALQVTPDGGYLVGGYSESGAGGDKSQPAVGGRDYWVVKLNAAGLKQWDQTLGGTGDDQLRALQVTSGGDLLLAGISDSGISGAKTEASRGSYDYWLVNLNATGQKQWDKTLGGTNDDELQTLLVRPDGSLVLGGYSSSAANGDKSLPQVGGYGYDYWLVNLNVAGQKQWDQTVGGSAQDDMWALVATPDGGYLLGGNSASGISGDKTQANQGSQDFWVVKVGGAATASKSAAVDQPFQLFPNPTRARFTVQLPSDTAPGNLYYSLLDATGRILESRPLPAATRGNAVVEVGPHPVGLYLLRLNGPKGYTATQQLILE